MIQLLDLPGEILGMILQETLYTRLGWVSPRHPNGPLSVRDQLQRHLNLRLVHSRVKEIVDPIVFSRWSLSVAGSKRSLVLQANMAVFSGLIRHVKALRIHHGHLPEHDSSLFGLLWSDLPRLQKLIVACPHWEFSLRFLPIPSSLPLFRNLRCFTLQDRSLVLWLPCVVQSAPSLLEIALDLRCSSGSVLPGKVSDDLSPVLRNSCKSIRSVRLLTIHSYAGHFTQNLLACMQLKAERVVLVSKNNLWQGTAEKHLSSLAYLASMDCLKELRIQVDGSRGYSYAGCFMLSSIYKGSYEQQRLALFDNMVLACQGRAVKLALEEVMAVGPQAMVERIIIT